MLEENGREVRAGLVETGDKIRPALRDRLVTLFVRPVEQKASAKNLMTPESAIGFAV